MNDTNKIPEIRLLITLQIVCAASAIASLRPGLIHPLWLLTFILPATLLLFLITGKHRYRVRVSIGVAIAVVAQATAAFLAYEYVGELDKQSSWACSLLPALTFFTLRREASDTSLSLFLSFCFLLIGIILNKEAADWTLLVFLGACTWALQIEASNRALMVRHAARGRVMLAGARFLRRSQVGAALMMVALLIYQGIALIPSPGRSTNRASIGSAGTHSRGMLGLSSRFDLSGNEGSPLNLTSKKVIHVKDPTGSSLPSDLYLRMTYFDHAYDNEEWKTQRPSFKTRPVKTTGFFVREAMRPRDRFPLHKMIVKRFEPASEREMFLPPGSVRITGLRLLEFWRTTGHFRSPDPSETGYGVDYQRPHKQARFGRIDPGLVSRRLKSLPPGLRTSKLISLAREWAGPLTRDSRPMAIARKIAGKLQRRCRYVLKEPTGPHDDALHNFLFGKHEGYCMHFATALAVMLRINRIPCRIGVGFHSGERAPDGARVFGSEHAHAWVELPLKNTGWTLVDPTPPNDRTRRGWPDPGIVDHAGPDTGDANSGMFSGSCLLAGLRDPLSNLGAFLTLAFVLIGLTIGLLVLATRRSRHASRRAAQERPTPDAVRARRMLDQILRVLAKYGHPKHQRATLEQYHGYLLREKSLDHPVLAGAFRAYQDVRFGAKNLDDDREESLAAGIAVANDVAT